MKAAVAREQARTAGGRPRELHRGVDGLGTRAGEEHRVETVRQAGREGFAEHPGEHRVVQLHTVDEVGIEHRVQNGAYVRMAVTEAGEALTGVEIQVRAPVFVIDVGTAR